MVGRQRRRPSVTRRRGARPFTDRSDVLLLRPLAEDDAAELRRIHATPEVARWWDSPDDDFPLKDDPDSTRWTIEVGGAVAGLIQFYEELEPKYRHASIDLFLDPRFHGTVGVMHAYERDAAGSARKQPPDE
jgi:aminoglycoside 6'-N-acetyltransferase